MSVVLTRETETRVQELIETGRYPNADTLIQRALEALEARERAQLDRLRELVLAGHNSGPGEVLTPELWDRLEREADEAYERGEQPAPHVCP